MAETDRLTDNEERGAMHLVDMVSIEGGPLALLDHIKDWPRNDRGRAIARAVRIWTAIVSQGVRPESLHDLETDAKIEKPSKFEHRK